MTTVAAPCQECRLDRIGAYCATTPCPCSCHGAIEATVERLRSNYAATSRWGAEVDLELSRSLADAASWKARAERYEQLLGDFNDAETLCEHAKKATAWEARAEALGKALYEACSMLDDALQLDDDFLTKWFPRIDGLRAVARYEEKKA